MVTERDHREDEERMDEDRATSSSRPDEVGESGGCVDILELTEDLLYKLGQQRSKEDVGGVDQELMVRLGQVFMQRAFGLVVWRAKFLVSTDGNCLPNALACINNPNKTKGETAERGDRLREVVIGKAIDYIGLASMEDLELIKAAAGGNFSKEELLTKLESYRASGEWAGDLGDLMPQIYASFTNTPLFVIAYSENNSLVGYFLKPSYIFKQPTLSAASSAVVHFQHHFEPVIIPNRLVRAWEAIYESYDTQDLQMAAIRVQLTQEDLRGDVGQRQQGQGGGNRLPGDYIGIITIDIFWSRRTQSFEPNSLLAFEYFVVLPPSVIVFLVFEFHFFR